jgi:small subunit ribosomal protein S20
MANHKSAQKRIRANAAKRLRNRYQAKTTRTLIKTVRNSSDKTEASELFKKVASLLDKLAKKNVIHKNKAANQKSKLAKFVSKIGSAPAVEVKKAARKTAAKKKSK